MSALRAPERQDAASTLLSELDAAGITLMADGEDLRFRTPSDVSIKPFVIRIKAHKPELLATVRQRELNAEVALLERGWAWLEANPNDPRYEAFEARWVERLQRYERSYSEAVSGGHEPAPPQRLVEVTFPPATWDGTLPEECDWPKTCGVLGPCPRSLAGGPCRLDAP